VLGDHEQWTATQRALAERLSPNTSVSEHVQGLLDIGLSTEDIARVAQTSPRAVRNWRSGQSQPRNLMSAAVDDLRAITLVLLHEGLKPQQAAQWLRSRRLETGQRPIDEIAFMPIEVIRAASVDARHYRGDAVGLAEDAARGGDWEWLPEDATPGPNEQKLPEGTRETERMAASLKTAGAVLGRDGQPLAADDPAYDKIELVFRGIADEVLRRLAARPELMRGLHWKDFETLVAELFRRDGFDVTPTPSSGDKGVDLFAARRTGLGSVLYVVECKQHQAPIGPDFVRQLAWVIERHRATGGVLVDASASPAGYRKG
jgi:hypothetical protein